MNKKKKIEFSAYAFLIPAGIIYLSVIIAPVFYSLYISLFKWNGIGDMQFTGLGNYVKLFTDDKIFAIAIKNNLIWIALTIIVTMSVSLALAVLLNNQFRGRTFFRGFFYFPCVIAPIAVAIIWRWIYNPNVGFINQFFKTIGIDYAQSWISDPKVSLFAIFAASLWQAVGQPMILFLAGLQSVSVDVLEAATIDGAGSVKKFLYVTVPLMKETFIIVIATLIVSAMKVFDVVQGLTAGGPANSTQMLSTYMYSQTFQYNNVGTGTAVACVMVLMMMLVIVPYVSFTAKEN
ncbi:carbohydrate ABC transporter permease [Anaerobium acetethylicum]|uniref:Raffinose/stachyose/melibiose transport system permease protein n=1 Tax=Anaerobium acetethylicum TaxID=1619234 RepID=A0A1D3TTS9_9FIRM|nr:sugar ABC transporter permease [Anaerobium acetethylicum]SCP97416.1 raffinose/stachyose/melibiose transport system permease protein [Anaerobium acetethylicum]